MTTKPIFLLKTLALIVCSAPFSSWTVFGQEKTRPEIAPSFMQTADQKDGNDSDGPHADYMDILGRSGLISILGDDHSNALVERLAADSQCFIQILDCNPVRVEQRRAELATSGHLGRVTVKTLYNSALPYPEHFVNALVVFNDQGVSRDEMTRVLAPGGVLLLLNGQEKILERWIKPWPSVMDDWPQSGHGPAIMRYPATSLSDRRVVCVGMPLLAGPPTTNACQGFPLQSAPAADSSI